MNTAMVLSVVLITGALVAWLLMPARRADDGPGTGVVARCLAGHVFTTMWGPPAPARKAGIGPVRLQYCPVGEHWTLVTPVRPEDLTPAEWRLARRCHDASVR
jgi:hypothetical protein